MRPTGTHPEKERMNEILRSSNIRGIVDFLKGTRADTVKEFFGKHVGVALLKYGTEYKFRLRQKHHSKPNVWMPVVDVCPAYAEELQGILTQAVQYLHKRCRRGTSH